MNKEMTEEYKNLSTAFRNAETKRGELIERWKEYERLYLGRLDGIEHATEAEMDIYPNIVMPTLNVIIALTLMKNPKAMVKARKQMKMGRAKLTQNVLMYWWERQDLLTEAQLMLRDAGIYGIGFGKTTWRYREVRTGIADPEEVEQMLEYRDSLSKVIGMDITEEDIVNLLIKETTQVIDNHPFSERVSPFEIVLDSAARSRRRMGWWAHDYHKVTEDIRKDKFYSRAVRLEIESDPTKTQSEANTYDPNTGRPLQSDTAGADLTRIVEIWSLRTRRLYITAYKDLGNPEKLLYAGNQPYLVGDPLTIFTLGPAYDVMDSVYPMGIVEQIAPDQAELFDVVVKQSRVRDAMIPKYGVAEENWTQELEEVLTSAVYGDIAKVRNTNGTPIREVVGQFVMPAMNPEFYMQEQKIKDRVYEKTGITEYQRGLVSSARSATEVSTVGEYAGSRLKMMQHGIRRALSDIARKQIGLGAQYMERSEEIRIADMTEEDVPNPDRLDGQGEHMSYIFNRHDIAGEYDYSVQIGSYEDDSDSARQQAALQELQIISQFESANKAEFLRRWLTERGHLDVDELVLTPEQMMMAQQQAAMGSMPGVGVPAPGGGRPPGPPISGAVPGAFGGVARAAGAARRSA